MKNLVIIYGGRSVEHDVSILTGLHAARNIVGYKVHLVYLTRDGGMLTGRALCDINYYTNGVGRAIECFFLKRTLFRKRLFVHKIAHVDAILNCCHGGVGENGELAGFFAVQGIPITSCDYISAANMQSKTRTKEILGAAGFLQAKYRSISKEEFSRLKFEELIPFCKQIFEDLGVKVIVKPDTLGSSIGINVATDEQKLGEALTLVFIVDNKAIIEEYFEGIKEINCSVFRDKCKVRVSKCEVIKNDKQVFDFETKYLDAGSGFTTKQNRKKINNAQETNDMKVLYKEIQELTRKSYILFGAHGVVRADFMVVDGKVYLNEINTVPGFLSYHLWLQSGIPYAVLIDMLVKQAISDNSHTLNTYFKSGILEKNRDLIQ